MRRVARVVPGAGEVVEGVATASGHDYARAGKPLIAWDDSDARAQLIDGLVRDANAVLAALGAEQARLQGPAADAVGLLGLVAGQDVEWVPDGASGAGTWRIVQRVAPDRMVSIVDPDARHAHKTTARRQDGFKAHIVIEPGTGLVTACAITKASGQGSGDAEAGITLLGADTTIAADQQVTVLGDSAYGTGDMLAALHTAGHIGVVKPWPVNPAVAGGFTVDDFIPDTAADTMTCPAGVTSKINRGRQVNFGVACRQCPLRERCTRSATGKSMRLREHDALARAHRARAADPGFIADYRHEPPVLAVPAIPQSSAAGCNRAFAGHNVSCYSGDVLSWSDAWREPGRRGASRRGAVVDHLPVRGRLTSRSSCSACPAARSSAAASWRAVPECMRATNRPFMLGGSLMTRTR